MIPTPQIPTESFQAGSERKVKGAQLCPTLCDPMDYTVCGIFQARIVGSLSLLPGIFPTQGLNPGLTALQADSLQAYAQGSGHKLNHKGSPKILDWVTYPFSS